MSKEQAFLMTSILQDVVKRGTGQNARLSSIQSAGKTGTTNKNIDAWFCGYTPSLEAIIWFGNDDNKPMNPTETGGRTSAPVFRYFFRHYLTFHPELEQKFIIPDGVKIYNIQGMKIYTTKTSPLPKITNEVNTIQENNMIY